MEDGSAAAVAEGVVEEPCCCESRVIPWGVQDDKVPEGLRAEALSVVLPMPVLQYLLELRIFFVSSECLLALDEFDASAEIDGGESCEVNFGILLFFVQDDGA